MVRTLSNKLNWTKQPTKKHTYFNFDIDVSLELEYAMPGWSSATHNVCYATNNKFIVHLCTLHTGTMHKHNLNFININFPVYVYVYAVCSYACACAAYVLSTQFCQLCVTQWSSVNSIKNYELTITVIVKVLFYKLQFSSIRLWYDGDGDFIAASNFVSLFERPLCCPHHHCRRRHLQP